MTTRYTQLMFDLRLYVR